MNVPGLSGTWQQRNKQLYEMLGSPQGRYTGSYDQNVWLRQQVLNNDYFKSGLPGQQQATQPTPPPAAPPQTSLADQYAQPGVDAGLATNVPSFQEALPFYDAWGALQPHALQSAESQVNPEAMRDYSRSYRDYMSGMTSSGGQRFGRALGGVGDLKAASERNRLASVQDWLGQYQQGFKDLFYNPSESAWNQAITQGKAPDQSLTNMPTWEDLYGKMSDAYGGSSPFYS